MKKIVLLALPLILTSILSGQTPEKEKVIAGAARAFDKIAKEISLPAPGCAVGVSLNGEMVYEKAFGLAEMEHGTPNTPLTIFESGSVAKQFTAAAVVLLSMEGKLSIDDPVRKYIPELPDYGSPLTIRHILTHTAGLRDWGNIMALTGSGRGDRVVTQDLAFDVIIRQKSLDFKPGTEYSYSNSGYQLAAMIVERVSKQKFPDFVSEKLFKPLGMKNSSWRDDYQRLVPARAQAYSRQGNGPWRLNMPFMNVYGNGGMLTTVGDWLKWNAMLDARSLGAPLVEAMETRGVLNDGRKLTYALGLDVDAYKGVKQISHDGGTAGYQTYLARYPEKKLSIAVLCNGAPPFSVDIVHDIVEEVLGPFPAPTPQPDGLQLTEAQLTKFVGVWRNEKTHNPNRVVFENGALRLNGTTMKASADNSFMFGTSRLTFTLDKDGRPVSAQVAASNGAVTTLIAETEWTPTAAELASFAGNWYSEEASAEFKVVIKGDTAFFVQRPTSMRPFRPIYKDHFAGEGFVMWLERDKSGKVDKLHIGAPRLRDIIFERVKP